MNTLFVSAAALALATLLPQTAAASSKEERMCAVAGFVPGTADFKQCVAVAKLNDGGASETIGNGLATQICDKHARKSLRYPVKNLQTSRVSGGQEKKVYISYSIDKSAENSNSVYAQQGVECVLRGRKLVDYKEVPY